MGGLYYYCCVFVFAIIITKRTHSREYGEFDICFPINGPFKYYFPPLLIAMIARTSVYSVSTGQIMSRPIIAYLCNPNSLKPISPDHPMYSTEKNPKTFNIISHPIGSNVFQSNATIKLCQFAANDFDLKDPKRFYSKYFKNYCSKSNKASGIVTLSSLPIHGSTIIAQGLYHIVNNIEEEFIFRSFVFSILNLSNEIISRKTFVFLIFTREVELKWIEPTPMFEVAANNPFNITLEIVDKQTQKRLEYGHNSALIVEVTISYQYKLFFRNALRQDFLHSTKAKLGGKEVITSYRNYDAVLHKRARNGIAHFHDVVIEDIITPVFLNATLLEPITGRRLMHLAKIIERNCTKTEKLDTEDTLIGNLFCETEDCGDDTVKNIYTWNSQCEVEPFTSLIGIKVTQQSAHGLQLVEIRNSEVEYVIPHFQIPGLWVVVVDEAGRRIYSGPDSKLEIQVKSDQVIEFCNNGNTFITHRGLGRFMGAICEGMANVKFYFTAFIPRTGTILTSEESKNYSLTGVVTIALFGRFNTAGLKDDPDPVLVTFAQFAINDLNLKNVLLKEFEYLMNSNITFKLKVYNTDQDFIKTVNSFMDLIAESTADTKEPIFGIIGFGSNKITQAMYAYVKSYTLPIIVYREFWREFTREEKYDLICSICWNEVQITGHMGHFSIDRGWTAIAVVEDTQIPIEPGFRSEMIRFKYSFHRLVVHNQTDLAKEITDLKARGVKFIYTSIHAPIQYFVLREAIKHNFTCVHGYQWVLHDLAAKQFDWENKHPLCAMKPTCTEAFVGMYLMHSFYNISSFSTPLWYHINRQFFEMNHLAYYGTPTVRTEIINGVIALGYDAVLSYAQALDMLIKTNSPIHKTLIPKAMAGVEFEGLTGRIKFSPIDCRRLGAMMSLSIVASDMKIGKTIVPTLYHKDLPVRILKQSDIYDDYTIQMMGKKKRALSFKSDTLSIENKFNEVRWIIEQNVESSITDLQLFKMPFRPTRKAMQEVFIPRFYLSTRGYLSKDMKALISHKENKNLSNLCVRTEVTTYSYRCKDGCGGGRLYSWKTNEYKHGKCVAHEECECMFFTKGKNQLVAYLGKQCKVPVCDLCLHGVCKTPYNCTCVFGWVGYLCSQPICPNGCGHGECIEPNLCQCKVGYYGANCDILIGVFAAAITFTTIFVIICLLICFRWLTKKKIERDLLRNLDWLVDWKDVLDRKQSQPRSGSGTPKVDEKIHPSPFTVTYINNAVFWKGQLCFAKKFYRSSLDVNSKEFRVEILQLKEMKHDNLVTFIGACPTAPNVALLVEVVPKGNLIDILSNEAYNLAWPFKFSILVDIANGMDYIHESRIGSHGRLKSKNCLIDNRWNCKITDFGIQSMRTLSIAAAEYEIQKSMLWTAPELLREHADPIGVGCGTKLGDVYSYGIIITELCTHDLPFTYELQILSLNELIRILKNFHDSANRGIKTLLETYDYDISQPIRPSVLITDLPHSSTERKGIERLIALTCNEEIDDRPTFKEILAHIKSFYHTKGGLVQNLIFMLENYANHLEDIIAKKQQQIEVEKTKTADLIACILPDTILQRLKIVRDFRPQFHSSVTILFSDLVDFTAIIKDSEPTEIIEMLTDLFTTIDNIISKFDVYKLDSIGNSYCIVSGLPEQNMDHYEHIATLALHMLSTINSFSIPHAPYTKLQIRIGIHTGKCMAGIVGVAMPRYCIFGEDVQIAQCMESHGETDVIQVSSFTAELLNEVGIYFLVHRTTLDLEFVGQVSTYWLLGKEGFGHLLPVSTPYSTPQSWNSDSSKSSLFIDYFGRRRSSRQSHLLYSQLSGIVRQKLMKSKRNVSFKEEELPQDILQDLMESDYSPPRKISFKEPLAVVKNDKYESEEEISIEEVIDDEADEDENITEQEMN